MGDADQQTGEEGMNVDRVTEFLDDFDVDISHLHHTVNELEAITMRAVCMQIKGYDDFRRFFVAINFILLPVILAIGITLGLKDVIAADSSKVMLQAVVSTLLFFSGSLGVPLYFGALWAMYRFSIPDDLLSDNFLNFVEDDIPSLSTHGSVSIPTSIEEVDEEIDQESTEIEAILETIDGESEINTSEHFAKESDEEILSFPVEEDSITEYTIEFPSEETSTTDEEN